MIIKTRKDKLARLQESQDAIQILVDKASKEKYKELRNSYLSQISCHCEICKSLIALL